MSYLQKTTNNYPFGYKFDSKCAQDITELFIRTEGFSGGQTLVELEIGGMDVPASQQKIITHTLSATEWKTVRIVSVQIFDDAESKLVDMFSEGFLGLIETYATLFLLRLSNKGSFMTTDYNDNTINRGFINYWYTPDAS